MDCSDQVKKVTVFTSASKIITLDKMSLDDAVGILVVFPQLLFSILDNWSSILLVPFFTDILYSYLNKGKKEKEHDFCVKSMQVCEWDDMLVFTI
ncbi:hypothetical protein NC652_036594 [Populus alba x Populus x berolinensis]|nr:hypothetical protein NC652_036594 [Populus alba x Populus x berolinensis]